MLSLFKRRKTNRVSKELVRDKMKDMFVSWKQTYGRGLNYYDLFKQPAYALAAFKIFEVPFMFMALLVPVWFTFWWVIGWVDRFKVKIWQKESEWGARQINPFEKEVMSLLKDINSKTQNTVPQTSIPVPRQYQRQQLYPQRSWGASPYAIIG